MASIAAHDYNCPNRTIEVDISANQGESWRVYGMAFPSGSGQCDDWPPDGAPYEEGTGTQSKGISDASFPDSGDVTYCIWLIQVTDSAQGSKNCNGGNSSSSSGSSSSSSSN